MLLRRIPICLIAALTIVAAPDGLAQPAGRPLAQILPAAHATSRSERVSDVRYDLSIQLGATQPDYAGSVTIRFELGSADGALTLDFDGGSIESLVVNERVASIDYNGYFLSLEPALLETGENRITVVFTRPYSTDGSGLYRFTDPEDGRVYLYTDFEPFEQNRLFPSFDQPDLKARFTTTVRAPADWIVISNTRETSVEPSATERVWHFPQTLPLSTYVYALHAGQYHQWESSAGNIPLRLFARESLAPYVYPEHWFEPTSQGLAFYQSYFEMPYPFGKYDQIIVPHFNAGAMENVGAVTFTERYLQRGGVTRQDRRAIASVILHEMAHMWFGDLVTMDWWNGLWLNESFATVMAVIALTRATEFDDEWQQSFLATVRAYRADERDTTHPIELAVPDTDSAFANFDAITYEKGSAALVQLLHLVGPENFRQGVADYLARHAYGNTTIDDFLDAISRAADIDLDQWAQDWLLAPGTNAVEIELQCNDATVSNLAVLQTAPDQWPTLRTHRAQLALYRFDTDHAVVDTIPLTYSGPRTETAAANALPCPDFVYANYGDWDYVRVRLSPATLTMLDGRLTMIDDPLARLMLWQSVWDGVLDARMAISAYVDFALANHPDETNESAIRQVLNALVSSADYIDQLVDDPVAQGAARQKIEAYFWQRLVNAAPGSDMQLVFFDTYVRAARSETAVDRLSDLLTGAAFPPAGLTIDTDRRWDAIRALARAGHPDAERLREAQARVDQSDSGHLRSLAITAARPDASVKADIIATLLGEQDVGTLADFRALAGGLFPNGQHDLQLQFASSALDGLTRLASTRDPAFFGAYTGGLLGPLCREDYRDQLDSVIGTSAGMHPMILRSLLDSRFETDRCLKMRRALATAD